MKLKKFSTQLDESTLKDLRALARSSERNITYIVNEAIGEYISRYKARPAFRKSMDVVLKDHKELLKKLAK